jgi:hypothetical protein
MKLAAKWIMAGISFSFTFYAFRVGRLFTLTDAIYACEREREG